MIPGVCNTQALALRLATTFDVNSGRITHFLNGDLLHIEEIPASLLVKKTRIGAASHGNWSIPTKPNSDFAIRNLNGHLDETAVCSAALSGDEITEMFENGKP